MSALEAVEPPEPEVERAEEIRMRMHMDMDDGRDIEMPAHGTPGQAQGQALGRTFGAGVEPPDTVMPDRLAGEAAAMAPGTASERDAVEEHVPSAILDALGPEFGRDAANEAQLHPDGPAAGMRPVAGGEVPAPAIDPAIGGRGIGGGEAPEPAETGPEEVRRIEPPPPPVEDAEPALPLFEGMGIGMGQTPVPVPDGPGPDDGSGEVEDLPPPEDSGDGAVAGEGPEPELPGQAEEEAEPEEEQKPEPPAPTPYVGLDPEDVPGPVGMDMGDRAMRKVRLPDTGDRPKGGIGTGYAVAGGEGLNAKASETWRRSHEAGDNAGILAMPDRQREIAGIIRVRQKEEGRLQGEAVEVGRRVMVPLVGREKTADRFEPGDTLILGANTGGTGIKPDSKVVVLGRDRGENPSEIAVRGVNPDGTEITALLNPALVPDGQVFRHIPMELMAGDRVRWRTDIRDAGVSAGETATVTAIEEGGRIELASDRTGGKGRWAMPVGHRAFAACDYAFNLSPLDIRQGAAENVVAVLDAKRPDLGIVNEVRREIGREAGNTVVVTDDKEGLNIRLERLDKALGIGSGVEGIIIGRDGTGRKPSREQSRGMGRGFGR